MTKIAKIIQQISYWPIYLFLKFFMHYRVEGQENLKGLEDGAVIFASNHASYIDGPVSALAVPRNGFAPGKFFPIRFLVAREFFGLRGQFQFPFSVFTAIYVRLNGSIPIRRKYEGLYRGLDDAVEALKQGGKIWLYPEGRITTDGRFHKPGKKGIAYLHKETNAPIVPAALIGTYKLSFFKTILRKNRIEVRFGKPICSFSDVSLEKGTEKVMEEIEKLMQTH